MSKRYEANAWLWHHQQHISPQLQVIHLLKVDATTNPPIGMPPRTRDPLAKRMARKSLFSRRAHDQPRKTDTARTRKGKIKARVELQRSLQRARDSILPGQRRCGRNEDSRYHPKRWHARGWRGLGDGLNDSTARVDAWGARKARASRAARHSRPDQNMPSRIEGNLAESVRRSYARARPAAQHRRRHRRIPPPNQARRALWLGTSAEE